MSGQGGAGRTWQNGTGETRRGGQHGPAQGREPAPAPAARPVTAELVRSNTGAFRDMERANAAIAALQAACNVVTPVAALAEVPDGHSMHLVPVHVDLGRPNETYPAGRTKVDGQFVDTFGLSKPTLERIAAAAGVSVVRSKRTDDGRNALICCWAVTVEMRSVHGELVKSTKSVEIDLTDGSPEAEALLGPKRSQGALDQQRRFITRIAESKAALRAIRTVLALPVAMTAEQLRRPFVAVKLVFDGSFEDPEMRREYARAKIAQATGAADLLLLGRRAPPALEAPEALEAEYGDPPDLDEAVDDPAPEPEPQVERDAHGWPVGHPLSADVLLHLAEAKGAPAAEAKALAAWLGRHTDEDARAKTRARFEAMPDPAEDNDPAPF